MTARQFGKMQKAQATPGSLINWCCTGKKDESVSEDDQPADTDGKKTDTPAQTPMMPRHNGDGLKTDAASVTRNSQSGKSVELRRKSKTAEMTEIATIALSAQSLEHLDQLLVTVHHANLLVDSEDRLQLRFAAKRGTRKERSPIAITVPPGRKGSSTSISEKVRMYNVSALLNERDPFCANQNISLQLKLMRQGTSKLVALGSLEVLCDGCVQKGFVKMCSRSSRKSQLELSAPESEASKSTVRANSSQFPEHYQNGNASNTKPTGIMDHDSKLGVAPSYLEEATSFIDDPNPSCSDQTNLQCSTPVKLPDTNGEMPAKIIQAPSKESLCSPVVAPATTASREFLKQDCDCRDGNAWPADVSVDESVRMRTIGGSPLDPSNAQMRQDSVLSDCSIKTLKPVRVPSLEEDAVPFMDDTSVRTELEGEIDSRTIREASFWLQMKFNEPNASASLFDAETEAENISQQIFASNHHPPTPYCDLAVASQSVSLQRHSGELLANVQCLNGDAYTYTQLPAASQCEPCQLDAKDATVFAALKTDESASSENALYCTESLVKVNEPVCKRPADAQSSAEQYDSGQTRCSMDDGTLHLVADACSGSADGAANGNSCLPAADAVLDQPTRRARSHQSFAPAPALACNAQETCTHTSPVAAYSYPLLSVSLNSGVGLHAREMPNVNFDANALKSPLDVMLPSSNDLNVRSKTDASYLPDDRLVTDPTYSAQPTMSNALHDAPLLHGNGSATLPSTTACLIDPMATIEAPSITAIVDATDELCSQDISQQESQSTPTHPIDYHRRTIESNHNESKRRLSYTTAALEPTSSTSGLMITIAISPVVEERLSPTIVQSSETQDLACECNEVTFGSGLLRTVRKRKNSQSTLVSHEKPTFTNLTDTYSQDQSDANYMGYSAQPLTIDGTHIASSVKQTLSNGNATIANSGFVSDELKEWPMSSTENQSAASERVLLTSSTEVRACDSSKPLGHAQEATGKQAQQSVAEAAEIELTAPRNVNVNVQVLARTQNTVEKSSGFVQLGSDSDPSNVEDSAQRKALRGIATQAGSATGVESGESNSTSPWPRPATDSCTAAESEHSVLVGAAQAQNATYESESSGVQPWLSSSTFDARNATPLLAAQFVDTNVTCSDLQRQQTVDFDIDSGIGFASPGNTHELKHEHEHDSMLKDTIGAREYTTRRLLNVNEDFQQGAHVLLDVCVDRTKTAGAQLDAKPPFASTNAAASVNIAGRPSPSVATLVPTMTTHDHNGHAETETEAAQSPAATDNGQSVLSLTTPLAHTRIANAPPQTVSQRLSATAPTMTPAHIATQHSDDLVCNNFISTGIESRGDAAPAHTTTSLDRQRLPDACGPATQTLHQAENALSMEAQKVNPNYQQAQPITYPTSPSHCSTNNLPTNISAISDKVTDIPKLASKNTLPGNSDTDNTQLRKNPCDLAVMCQEEQINSTPEDSSLNETRLSDSPSQNDDAEAMVTMLTAELLPENTEHDVLLQNDSDCEPVEQIMLITAATAPLQTVIVGRTQAQPRHPTPTNKQRKSTESSTRDVDAPRDNPERNTTLTKENRESTPVTSRASSVRRGLRPVPTSPAIASCSASANAKAHETPEFVRRKRKEPANGKRRRTSSCPVLNIRSESSQNREQRPISPAFSVANTENRSVCSPHSSGQYKLRLTLQQWRVSTSMSAMFHNALELERSKSRESCQGRALADDSTAHSTDGETDSILAFSFGQRRVPHIRISSVSPDREVAYRNYNRQRSSSNVTGGDNDDMEVFTSVSPAWQRERDPSRTFAFSDVYDVVSVPFYTLLPNESVNASERIREISRKIKEASVLEKHARDLNGMLVADSVDVETAANAYDRLPNIEKRLLSFIRRTRNTPRIAQRGSTEELNLLEAEINEQLTSLRNQCSKHLDSNPLRVPLRSNAILSPSANMFGRLHALNEQDSGLNLLASSPQNTSVVQRQSAKGLARPQASLSLSMRGSRSFLTSSMRNLLNVERFYGFHGMNFAKPSASQVGTSHFSSLNQNK